MTTQDQKAALVESAMGLFHQHGFSATGAREIAKAAGVPQGSFTNHFRSKEQLGVAALERYFDRLNEIMRATLEDRSLPPEGRVLAYFRLIGAQLSEANWRQGCLIPDLAAEIPAHSEVIRPRLKKIMAVQAAAFESVLAEVTCEGEARDLAFMLISAWHGTLLRIKVERGREPLDRFERIARRMIETASRH